MRKQRTNGKAEKPKRQDADNQILQLQAQSKDHPVTRIERLTAVSSKGFVRAVVETCRGSRNKYDYDVQSGLFECDSALQGGMTFPFDFGFIPSTVAADGDPIDVIILMDEASFAGCLVQIKLIGVLEAEQTEGKNTFRNDRLIGVHIKSVDYGEFDNWQDLPASLTQEIEMFFVNYNRCKNRLFKPLGWRGPKQAIKLLDKALKAKNQKQKKSA
jgi:inorganic pyrophosphatase